MRNWLVSRLIRAMDRVAYWLLANREPAIISAGGPHTRSAASE
jgi:hypothetical protein